MAFVDFTDEELQEALSNAFMIKKDKAKLKKVSLVAGSDTYYTLGQDGSYQLLHLSDYNSSGYKNAVAYVDKLQKARDNVTLEVIHDQEQYGDDTFFDIREWSYKNFYYLEITYIYSKKTYIVLSSALQQHIYEYLGNMEIFTPQVFEAGGSVDINTIKQQLGDSYANELASNNEFAEKVVANLENKQWVLNNLLSNLTRNSDFTNALINKFGLNNILNALVESDTFFDKLSTHSRFTELLSKKVDEVIANDSALEKLAIKLIDYMHLNGVDFTYAPNIMRVTIVDENGQAVNLALDKENGIYQTAVDLNGRYTIQVSARDEL